MPLPHHSDAVYKRLCTVWAAQSPAAELAVTWVCDHMDTTAKTSTGALAACVLHASNAQLAMPTCVAPKRNPPKVSHHSGQPSSCTRCLLWPELLDTFALLIVEELLRNTVHKDMILENQRGLSANAGDQ